MKKVIFGLLLLVGGVLFLINYLGVITLNQTDKVSDNAQKQLVATGNNPMQNQPIVDKKSAETKPAFPEQFKDTLVKELVNQVTDSTIEPLNKQLSVTEKPKSPIARIKIHDKKTDKDITIETQAQLEAQNQTLTPTQQEEEKSKAEKFKSFYHKSKKCESPDDKETRVACGNEYMRAKAKFEELYKAGKL